MTPTTPAARAEIALATYEYPDQRIVDQITDFLPDLMHLCARDGLDFEDLLRSARRNFAAELANAASLVTAQPLLNHLAGILAEAATC